MIQLIGDALRWCRLSVRSSRSLKAIITLARAFSLTIVAEGVETAEQLQALRY